MTCPDCDHAALHAEVEVLKLANATFVGTFEELARLHDENKRLQQQVHDLKNDLTVERAGRSAVREEQILRLREIVERLHADGEALRRGILHVSLRQAHPDDPLRRRLEREYGLHDHDPQSCKQCSGHPLA